MQEILRRVHPKPGATHVLLHAEQGFTANVPLAEPGSPGSPASNTPRQRAIVRRSRLPITTYRSTPLRVEVGKWLRGLEFLDHDIPGFWEQNGYHMYGDP